MNSTLIDEIKQVIVIENFPEYIDKSKLVREAVTKVWEKWKNNRVVRDVTEGRTTFEKEFEQTFKYYSYWRAWLPHSVPEVFKKKFADLEECIGAYYTSNFLTTKVMKPPTLSLLGGLGSKIALWLVEAGQHIEEKERFNRREFLKKRIYTYPLVGAIFGGGLGTLGSYLDMINIHESKKDAKYLDMIYQKYIKEH